MIRLVVRSRRMAPSTDAVRFSMPCAARMVFIVVPSLSRAARRETAQRPTVTGK